MQAYIDAFFALIAAHQSWAGPIIGLLSFGESLLIVGLFVPATVILPLTGVLIANGSLEFIPICAWGIAGAIAGDAVSYWLGRAYGQRLLRLDSMQRRRRLLARARLLFYRYGFLAVFMGRFMGALRSLIPGMAGIMRMPQGRFQIANIISGVLWFPYLLMPGYLGAKGVNALHEETVGLIGLGAVLMIVLILAASVALNKRKRRQARRESQ